MDGCKGDENLLLQSGRWMVQVFWFFTTSSLVLSTTSRRRHRGKIYFKISFMRNISFNSPEVVLLVTINLVQFICYYFHFNRRNNSILYRLKEWEGKFIQEDDTDWFLNAHILRIITVVFIITTARLMYVLASSSSKIINGSLFVILVQGSGSCQVSGFLNILIA